MWVCFWNIIRSFKSRHHLQNTGALLIPSVSHFIGSWPNSFVKSQVPFHLWEQRNPWLSPSYRSIAQGIPLLNTQPVLVKPQVVSASLWKKKSWLTPSYRSIAQDISFQNTPVLFLSTREQVSSLLWIYNGYFTMVPLCTTSTRTRYGEQHHLVL